MRECRRGPANYSVGARLDRGCANGTGIFSGATVNPAGVRRGATSVAERTQ